MMAADPTNSSQPPESVLGRLWATTPRMSGAERLRVFELLPPSMQRQAWAELERAARKEWR